VTLRLASSGDLNMLIAVARAAPPSEVEAIVERTQEALSDSDPQVRDTAFRVLRSLPPNLKTESSLLDHLGVETWPRLACDIAGFLGHRVPEALVAEIALNALRDSAPSTRLMGVDLLKQLPLQMATRVSLKEAESEPDPLIQERLRSIARA
jgi:hypothetical protein